MNNKIVPWSRLGIKFYSLPPEKRAAIETLASKEIEEYIIGLGETARFTTPRNVFDAIGPGLYQMTGVWPRYFFHKIERDFGLYLATLRGPGISFPIKKVLPFGPPPIARSASIVVSEKCINDQTKLSVDVDCDFTPYAALVTGEPHNSSVDDFDSFSIDAHVRALRIIINGSPQYGARRTELGADFIGLMRWRLCRAIAPIEKASEGRSMLAAPLAADIQEKRVVVDLRALKWHLEGEERSSDFPTLFQEAYGLSRQAAWLMACALIRATYLADTAAAQRLVAFCTERLAKRGAPNLDAHEKTTLLQVKAIWSSLCESTV
jgi:hypothetical protein